MDIDLARYICTYCTEFYNGKERKAADHNYGLLKYSHVTDEFPDKWKKIRDRFITTDQDAIALLNDGYDNFIINAADRIYREHFTDLKLNLCPKCGKIARTPKAKQCRYCEHNWH